VRKLSPRGRTVVFGLVLVVLVAILFPAVVTAKYVVVIDDGSHGFEKHGPAKWWHKVRGIGFGGDMFWTWNNKNRVDNYVVWRPNLKYTGYYKVYVFIPRNYAYTKNAYYEIYHAHGKTVKKIDQSRYYDTWVYLGKYYFKAGKGCVKLTDKTGERWATKKIGFDAIKFELVKKTNKPKQGILLHFDLNFKGSLSDAKHRRGDGKDEKTITVKPGQELRLYIFYKEGNTKNPYIVRVYPSWNKNRFIANSDNNEQISEVGWEIGGGRWDVQKFKAPTKPGKYEIRVVYKKGKKAPTYYRYDRLLAKGYVIVKNSQKDNFQYPVGNPNKLTWRISQPFGNRRGNKRHTGVDLNLPGSRDLGKPVKATAKGIVIESCYARGWGNVIVIKHNSPVGEVYSLYAHLKDRVVKKGDKVNKGQIIGHVGSTGYSTGPHLHFEIKSTKLRPLYGGYKQNLNGFYNPIEFIRKY